MRVALAAGICVLSATMGFAQTAKKPMAARRMAKSGVADMLMKQENALQAAVMKKDWATFKKWVTADAWNVDENGPMSLAEFLKVLQDPKSDFKYESTTSEMKVANVNASTKVVVYKLEQKGGFMGQTFPPTVWASTVWANRGGRWRAVFHQESTAAKK